LHILGHLIELNLIKRGTNVRDIFVHRLVQTEYRAYIDEQLLILAYVRAVLITRRSTSGGIQIAERGGPPGEALCQLRETADKLCLVRLISLQKLRLS
jgi:hypothetical protein